MNLSIVTIHLNEWDSLAKTASSLDSLIQHPGVEWIVMDGGSALETSTAISLRDSLQSLADQYVSEPDEGIYQAMNKGTALAKGTYVLYLNAGDELHPSFNFADFIEAAGETQAGMIWGQAWDRDKHGKVYLRKSRDPAWLKYGIPVCHQAVFFRRDLLGVHPYREDLVIAADYELLCRLHHAGCPINMLDIPVVIFELTGISSVRSGLAMAEESAIRMQYFPRPALVEKLLTGLKHLLWKSSMRFPQLRRLWRRWL